MRYFPELGEQRIIFSKSRFFQKFYLGIYFKHKILFTFHQNNFPSPFLIYCFFHPIFGFWFLVTFVNKVMKIPKYYVIFVFILQGKMAKTEKMERKLCNQSVQNTRNQKMKIWYKQNISSNLLSSCIILSCNILLWKLTRHIKIKTN